MNGKKIGITVLKTNCSYAFAVTFDVDLGSR